MKIKKYYIVAALASFALCGCGDIADTFSEWTEGGEKRYVGETENFQLKSGWDRLIASWDSPVDPAITKIKVKWTDDDAKSDSAMLDRNITSYNITGLKNSSYSVTLTAVSGEGKESLSSTLYARPYTEEHEVIQSFSRIISSYYFMNDRLVLKFLGWEDGMMNAVLKYTKENGEADSLVITKDMANGEDNELFEEYWEDCPYMLLPDAVDKTKPILLYRTGRVSGCEDVIHFPVFELTPDRTFSSDFKEILKKTYGLSSTALDADGNVKDEWADKVTSLSIDDDLTNFDDLLNFPKLKSVYLGKHRYLTDAGIKDASRGQLNVGEKLPSIFAVTTLHELNGLTIYRYNKHFQRLGSLDFIKDMGKPTMPDYKFYDLHKASVNVSPDDEEGYDSHPEYLVDNNTESCWSPLAQTGSVDYSITIDLKSEKTVSGIKIVQKNFGKYDQDMDYALSMVKVYAADKSGIFEQATNLNENYIGTSAGETIVLPFSNKRNIRYVRLTFPANAYHGFFGVTFAEVGLYE
mgnify:CR=1 FL=1